MFSSVRAVVAPVKAGVRGVASVQPRGKGGRSSVSGISATVFGSTGFLGRYVVNRLGRIGSQVICPYRGDEHDYRHLRVMGDIGQILFYDYQLLDEASVRKCVKHSSVVINLVGQDTDSRHFALDDVHVRGADIIARAARDAGVNTLIHVSALNASHSSPSAFLRSKALGEEAVRDAFPSAVIVRPSDMFGAEDRFLNRLAKQAALPLGQPLLYGGKQIKMPVSVSDVAQGIANITANPDAAKGQTFEFVGPKAYSMAQLARLVNDVIRKPQKTMWIPTEAMLVIARALELSPFDPFLTREDVIRQSLNDELTGAPMLQELGITPATVESLVVSFLRRYRIARHQEDVVEY